MRRFLLAGAAATLLAGAAQAQRLEVDPARTTSFEKPILTRPGELIASEISNTDFHVGPGYESEQFAFTGRAGETVTAQVRSEIPTLEVVFREKGYSGKVLARGPAKDAPVRATLPKDGSYFLIVGAGGPQRFGKYLLSFGSGDSAPPFEPPKAAPVQVAQAAPVPAAPKAAAAPAKAPAPAAAPVLPVVPGVTNIRAGQVVTRPPGKLGPNVETFRLLAAAGTRIVASARGDGPLIVTAYTPEGAAMLAAEGAGSASLEVIAPIDGVYFLTVGRKSAAKGYRLTLAAVEAKLLDADFIERIGYEVPEANGRSHWSCWIEPGVKSLSHASDGRLITHTYLGAGRGRGEWTSGGEAKTSIWTRRVEGDEIVVENQNGTKTRYTPFTGPHGAYRGYLCK